MTAEKRIVIIGAGPTGLGAAWRLRERGHENFVVYEARDTAGGLSSSVVDDAGFTWDIGGHVAFSRMDGFHRFFERFCPESLEHLRESWIRCQGAWVPYPFQNNIRYLPRDAMLECLLGLVDAQTGERFADGDPRLRRFDHWMRHIFGDGICEHFIEPDNFKRWATPADRMSSDWIADRVSVVDLKAVIENVILERDDVSWGPNSTFRFPLRGGTGSIFENCAAAVDGKIRYGARVVGVSSGARELTLDNGDSDGYDVLINSAHLDAFAGAVADAPASIGQAAAGLEHNGIYVVGVGLRRKLESSRCWMYFPEENVPFHRVTNFSNYSPHNVPDGDTERYCSLMCEVTYSRHKPVNAETVAERVVDGLIAAGLMSDEDRGLIASTHIIHEPYAYPIPTPERNAILATVLPWLGERGIHSCGRFGAWRYEEGNMDHCVMAGAQAVDSVLGR